MRKQFKSIVLACLVAVLVLFLASCGGGKDVIIASPDAPFTGNILYGDDSDISDISRDAAIELKDELSERSLGNVHSVLPTSMIEELKGEIILGSSTTRKASVKANDLLEDKGAYDSEDLYWSYCCLDGTLAIAANNKLAYSLAIRELFETYLSDGALVIPGNLLVCDSFAFADYEAQFDLPRGEEFNDDLPDVVGPAIVFDEMYDLGQGSSLFVIKDSDIWDYTDLREELAEDGFVYYTGNRIGDNVFATYASKTKIVHTMFFYNKNEIRVSVDNRGEGTDGFSLPGLESENVYTRTGESNMTLVEVENADYDGGLCMIFKLADGRFFIIDSGIRGRTEYSGTSAGWVYATLAKHAEDPENITVAAWLLTHTHSDHIGGLYDMANGVYYTDGAQHTLMPENITKKIEIQRIIYSEPSDPEDKYSCDGWMERIITAFDVETVVKAHPGQEIFVSDLTLTIYGSQDLVIDQADNITNMNEFSITSMIEFNGKRLLSLGDSYPKHNAQLAKIYKTELKADVIQVAHHGYADTGAKSVNNYCNPDIVLWPNSEEGMQRYTVLTREQNAIFLDKENYAPHGGNIDFDAEWNASEPYRVLDMIPVCPCGCGTKSAIDTSTRDLYGSNKD